MPLQLTALFRKVPEGIHWVRGGVARRKHAGRHSRRGSRQSSGSRRARDRGEPHPRPRGCGAGRHSRASEPAGVKRRELLRRTANLPPLLCRDQQLWLAASCVHTPQPTLPHPSVVQDHIVRCPGTGSAARSPSDGRRKASGRRNAPKLVGGEEANLPAIVREERSTRTTVSASRWSLPVFSRPDPDDSGCGEGNPPPVGRHRQHTVCTGSCQTGTIRPSVRLTSDAGTL
ncbi:hypothetical protein BH24ACI4_BH24ACI4_25250 [soil metagenome]